MAYDYDDFMREWTSPTEYVIAHTSGSTGMPKQIKLLKSDMRMSARATNAFFGITSDSVLAVPLSMEYIAGKMMVVRALEAGCAIDVIPPSNAFTIERRASLLAVVPTQVPRLISLSDEASGSGKYGILSICDNVIVGGAALSQADAKKLVKQPFKTYCTYGMTETCSHVALMDIADESNLYHALDGIRFSTDTRGCLVITADTYSYRQLVTNDIVSLVDDRTFRWIGRYDNVINSGGLKLHPEQMERLYTDVLTLPMYVVGVPDPRWGQAVALVVETTKMCAEEILDMLADKIDNHRLLPKKIVIVDKLPTTSTGKIKREVPQE